MIKEVVGFEGKIKFDKSKPDGTPRKLLDSTILNEKGWNPKIKLKKGIRGLYNHYQKIDLKNNMFNDSPLFNK